MTGTLALLMNALNRTVAISRKQNEDPKQGRRRREHCPITADKLTAGQTGRLDMSKGGR